MFHLSKPPPESISISSGHMAGMVLTMMVSCIEDSYISTDNQMVIYDLVIFGSNVDLPFSCFNIP